MSAPLASPTSAAEAQALHDEDLLRLIRRGARRFAEPEARKRGIYG